MTRRQATTIVEMNPYNIFVLTRARRTSFIARFIVLREGKKSKAHREIERMEWRDDTSAEEIAEKFREVFKQHADSKVSYERDLKRALEHANRLYPSAPDDKQSISDPNFCLWHLVEEYNKRATTNFIDSLFDYERSNFLLFGEDEEQPRHGGWRLPQELERCHRKNISKQQTLHMQ